MSFLPDFQQSRYLPLPVSPALLVGAASPLWPYFSGLAATGVAWWWMTRLSPQNLEAMFAAVAPKLTEAAAAATEAADVVEAVVEAAPESGLAPVVGGEAAPVSPVLAEVPPEPRTLDAAPEAELASPKPRRAVATPPVADA